MSSQKGLRGSGGTAVSHSKELLSFAYIQALCAATGLNHNEPEIDNDGVDITLRGKNFTGRFSSPKVEIQLKCTSSHSYIDTATNELVYPLPVHNYNYLVEPSIIPILLAVHFAPIDQVCWLQHKDLGLTLRYATYWCSLAGLPPSANKSNISVRIPLAQRLGPNTLLWMMQQVSQGYPIQNNVGAPV
ncbi:DUF4365 domain-containing protein [Pseudomonas sp. EA_35y_Pfl2_R111]|uniref:DUF4365 domain-containing protein n=1 Tax=Pseudomonas sp. EA_35y_Pfl2_R111 TaxID=3088689 RepID=UPI0030DD4616